MKKIKCPDCGSHLLLETPMKYILQQKIMYNGSILKSKWESQHEKDCNQRECLRCSNDCGFVYDVDGLGNSRKYEILDNWINNNL